MEAFDGLEMIQHYWKKKKKKKKRADVQPMVSQSSNKEQRLQYLKCKVSEREVVTTI